MIRALAISAAGVFTLAVVLFLEPDIRIREWWRRRR